MDRDTFRELKESGGLVADAALQSEDASKIEIVEDQDEIETQEEQQEPEEAPAVEIEDHAEPSDEQEEDDLPPLSEKEKTAFEKRMERERAKLQEKLEAELKEQYEQQYGKHKQVLESLGGDPDAILQRIQENKMMQEAQRMAEANGWDEDQTQWYINDQRGKMEQKRRDKELQELRVQMQINRLRDNPDYAGISQMEKDIIGKIDRTNGALTVEEAYWALGGPKRAEQIRVEAQMREQVKRAKQPRTVLTDTPAATTGEKPLPPEIARDAERMGISMAEARRLMNSEPAQDIESWRKQRKAK